MKYFNNILIVLLAVFLMFGCASFQKQDTMSREQLQELAEGTGAAKIRAFYGIDGEATGDLDDIDAALLNDLDMAIVIMADYQSYLYILDANNAGAQDIPNIVTPSGTAGDKRWVLAGKMTALTNYEEVQLPIVEWATEVAVVATGAFWFHIGERLAGMNLVYCHAENIVAATGTGTTTIQIYNVTQTADMLTTELTIDEDETGSDQATAYAIDAANDDVAENDVIRIDIDAVPSTTGGNGLIVTLGFEKPYTP